MSDVAPKINEGQPLSIVLDGKETLLFPDPKAAQLARGERRRARKVASRKEWAAITAEKLGPCRVCCNPGHNGSQWSKIQLHHLVSRAQGGDDVEDNIVPLCLTCHAVIHAGHFAERSLLVDALTEAERAYVIGKRGSLRL